MMASLHWRRYERTAAGVLLAAVVLVGLFGSKLALYNMTITALFAGAVIGLNMLLGLAGQASFAQTTFMAIGGYGSALLTTKVGWNPWIAIAIAAGASALAAAVIGATLLRLRGHYLSMATFALSLGIYYFATAADWLTGGGTGIAGVPPLSVAGIAIDTGRGFYVLAWIFCAIGLALYASIAHTHVGRAWRAISAGPEIAMALGIRINHYKLLAFVLAAVLASAAGSLYVHYTSFAGPDLYDINIILNLFFMLFVGGRGSIVGPVVGAAIVVLLPQAMSGLQDWQQITFYGLLGLLLLARPQGLFGGPAVIGRRAAARAQAPSTKAQAAR